MFNIIEGISLQSRNIIKYYNIEKFEYDNYLAISTFILLSSIVVVDNQLGKKDEIFC